MRRKHRVVDGWVSLSWALVVAVSLSGCMHNAQPRKKLADVVHSMNDAARWGRIGTAVAMVEPGYQGRFVDAHRGWGESIQLADSEVVQVDLGPDESGATAVVSYSWYNLATMTLHSTTVEQQWVRHDARFTLASEAVIKGDSTLFAPPKDSVTGASPTPQPPAHAEPSAAR